MINPDFMRQLAASFCEMAQRARTGPAQDECDRLANLAARAADFLKPATPAPGPFCVDEPEDGGPCVHCGRDVPETHEQRCAPPAATGGEPKRDYTELNEDSAKVLEEVAQRIESGGLSPVRDASALALIANEIRAALSAREAGPDEDGCPHNGRHMHGPCGQCGAPQCCKRCCDETLRAELTRVELDSLRAKLAEVEKERETLSADRDQLRASRDQALGMRDAAIRKREEAQQEAAMHLDQGHVQCRGREQAEAERNAAIRRVEELERKLGDVRELIDDWRAWAEEIVGHKYTSNLELRAALDAKLREVAEVLAEVARWRGTRLGDLLPSSPAAREVEFTAEERDAVNYYAAYCNDDRRHAALTSVIEKIEQRLWAGK